MRSVIRMQLRMTAPNIGELDAQDTALAGEDHFDLGEGERGIKRRKGDLADALGDEGLEGSDEEEAGNAGSESEEDFLDSEDEREAKTKSLENEMDGLYDTYQTHMQEKDAKFRVKEARRKDKHRESWKGIDDPKESESEEESEEEGVEGGWENREKNRAHIGEEADSSDDSDDDEEMQLDTPVSSARRSLLQKLDDGSEVSSAAKVWFDQSVFKGLDEFDDDEEEEEAEMTDDEESSDEELEDAEEEEEEEAVVAAHQMSDSEVGPPFHFLSPP